MLQPKPAKPKPAKPKPTKPNPKPPKPAVGRTSVTSTATTAVASPPNATPSKTATQPNPALPTGAVAGGPSVGTDSGPAGSGRSVPANLALVLLLLTTLGAAALALIPAVPGAQMILRPRQAAKVARRRPELIALAISGLVILLILVSL